jgi:hypothetical protein
MCYTSQHQDEEEEGGGEEEERYIHVSDDTYYIQYDRSTFVRWALEKRLL